jgi:hypothetical protein
VADYHLVEPANGPDLQTVGAASKEEILTRLADDPWY